MLKTTMLAGLIALGAGVATAQEGHEAAQVTDYGFSFEGPFGRFDQAQLQRGLQVYTEVCAACHGLKFLPYRELAEEGGPHLPEAQMRAYAAQFEVTDPATGQLVWRNYLDLKDPQGRHDVYEMMVAGFSNDFLAVLYLVAQVVLFVHLRHGIPSLFQTLGLKNARFRGPIDIALGGRPVADGDPQRGHAVPRRAAGPARAVLLHAGNHLPRARVRIGAFDAHEHLIEHHVVQQAQRSVTRQALGHPDRETAGPLDEIGEPVTAERRHGCVDGHGARAA